MVDARARSVIDNYQRMDSDRATWKNHWQQIADLTLPERNDYLVERTPGMKRNQLIYDSTPLFALQQFANGLHSLLTSPTLIWFSLFSDDDRLNNMGEVRAWFDYVTQVMYSIFNGPRHNFASQSHEYYLDLGSIGTAAMAVLESDVSGILFSTRGMKECVIFENDEDRIDGLTRKWKYTARQAVEAWGKDAGDEVNRAFEQNPNRKFTFYHQVKPRIKRNASRADRMNKAFESVYVGETDGNIIAEGGFDDFPYLVSRFSKAADETYGRGPGMTMLPDIKMLNELMKMVVKSAQKIVDPPLMIPDDGFMLPIKTVPGSQNFYRANSQNRIEPLKTDGQVQLGVEMVNALRQQILRGFYVEWMMMPSDPADPASSGKGVTATYVLQQRDEKMRLLSPMLARLQSEFLGPLIDRTFAILWKKSATAGFDPARGSPLPPPPAVLSGSRWHPEYVSPIAVAQRSSELDATNRLLNLQLQFKQMDPNTPMIVDAEAVMRLASRDLNAPVTALKSPEVMQQEAQARAQQMQQQQQHDQMEQKAGAMADGTQAVKNLADAQAAGNA